MRTRLGIIFTIVAVIAVLVVINSLAYVSADKTQDTESLPNRSTYNGGATGTRALYDLLSESGYKVVRWREIPEKLFEGSGEKVNTFVIVGRTRLPIDNEQARSLLRWVAQGGRLVIIDRLPESYLLPRSGNWAVSTELLNFPPTNVDPSNAEEMTENVKPLQPSQPTLLTQQIQSVMPSRFAAVVKVSAIENKRSVPSEHGSNSDSSNNADEEPSPPVPAKVTGDKESKAVSPAPVVHLKKSEGALLVDYAYGGGTIAVLSDPYIVSNGGIRLKDNLQLSINLLTSSGGLIAFDEFHQGKGTTSNALISYFSGTPVLPIAGQIVLVVLFLLWTRGRRFARPLPLPQVDRRSGLEFVASMAELQQRSRAFDLAIENIYSRTRRVLARYAGVEYNSPRKEIAGRIAARTSLDAHQLETVMRQCEEAINGQPISERQSIQLVKRLREIEAQLGLRMRSREIKQAAQNI